MLVTTKIKVLVVGQTPPPYHGQAVMVEHLLKGRFDRLEMRHVRMAFSRNTDEIGLFRWRKIVHLLGVVFRIAQARLAWGAAVLYYPPFGTGRAPVYRDMFILSATRWMFSRLVFHLHAGGISEFVPRQPRWFRALFRVACCRPDCAIELYAGGPPDGTFLRARKTVVIPNGIPDSAGGELRREAWRGRPIVLFVGALRESKGVRFLVEAWKALRARAVEVDLDLMGEADSAEFEAAMRSAAGPGDAGGSVRFLGVRTGDAKWDAYRRADVFCFPSYYEAEGIPLVILEAMQFGLPVVASQWRGIPTVVREGETGWLVPPRDVELLAGRLEELLRDARRRSEMGKRGRAVFLQEFSIDRWRQKMEKAIHGAIDLGGKCAQSEAASAGRD